jgi:hypothetical protein
LFILLFRVPLRLRHRFDWRKHLPKSETLTAKHYGKLLRTFSVTTRMVSRWYASSWVLRHHKNGFTLVCFFLRSPSPQEWFHAIPSRLVIGTLLGVSATIILRFHISTPSFFVASVGTAWKLSGWTRIVQWRYRHILSQAPHVGWLRLEFRGTVWGISTAFY